MVSNQNLKKLVDNIKQADRMEENLGDFGREIEADGVFHFECHPALSCFGRCCRMDISLTSYDIARLRTHLKIDTTSFLSTHSATYADPETGFPSVSLKRNDDGTCLFSHNGGCEVYKSRPSCCRSYPLSRVIDEDGMTGKRWVKYRLQEGVDYCEGLGRGKEWTIKAYCDANHLERYERANDLFLDVAFEFYRLPHSVRYNKDVQLMVYRVVFNFDKFFDEYGKFPHTRLPENDDEIMELIRAVALRLIERAAEPQQRAHSP